MENKQQLKVVLEKVSPVDIYISDEILPEHIRYSSQGISINLDIKHYGETHNVLVTIINQIDRTEGEIIIIKIVSTTEYKITCPENFFRSPATDNLLNLLNGLATNAQAHNIGMQQMKMKGTPLEGFPIVVMPPTVLYMQIMDQTRNFLLN